MYGFIEEKNVSPVTLSLELKTAVIKHKLEEDEAIYITESGFSPARFAY